MKSFVFLYLSLANQIDWAANIRKSWDFSEDGAHARLEAFLHDGETPCECYKCITHFWETFRKETMI